MKMLELPIPNHGNLTHWAEQGVFLLNASLTVRAGEPMSHSKIGWAEFTDTVIKKISGEKKHVVFLLWGKFAQEKRVLIDESKHLILRAAHPSPFQHMPVFLVANIFQKQMNGLLKMELIRSIGDLNKLETQRDSKVNILFNLASISI